MSLQETYLKMAEVRKRREEEAAILKKAKEQSETPAETKREEISREKSWLQKAFAKTEDSSEDEADSQPIVPKWVAALIYVVGQGLAIWIEFGLVFFILSLIVLIYLNTGRRKRGELSAYSVFNEQCERLPGQMTAEHFERDMLRQRRD